MEHLFWVWLAFNIVFGLWSARNWLIWGWSVLTSKSIDQSDLGRILDMLVLVSILAMIFMFDASVDGSSIVFNLKAI